jgi:hypothetical protein
MNEAVFNSITIFIILLIFLYMTKLPLFFTKTGSIKSFGLIYNDDTTPIPLMVFSYGILLILYFLGNIYNL